MIVFLIIGLVLFGTAVVLITRGVAAARLRTADNLGQIGRYGFVGTPELKPIGGLRGYIDSAAAGIGRLFTEDLHLVNEERLRKTLIAAGMYRTSPRTIIGYQLLFGIALPTVQCNAEALPFKSRTFDCVSIAFGLRNVTRKEAALAEMRRVLRPGGVALVLEFSRVWAPLAPAYDWYSFNVLPRLGKRIANDEASYRYLAESIRVHPDQQSLKATMMEAGFDRVEYHNLAAGIVALHIGRVY